MKKAQKGTTIIEQVIVVTIITFAIVAWLMVLRVTTKGVVTTRDSLEAQTLATSKMEDVRNAAVNAALAGDEGQAWRYVTRSPLALQYAQFNYLTKGARVFQWRVMSDFCQGVTAASMVTVSAVTNFISFTAEVYWPDPHGQGGLSPTVKAVTITGFAANYKYNF